MVTTANGDAGVIVYFEWNTPRYVSYFTNTLTLMYDELNLNGQEVKGDIYIIVCIIFPKQKTKEKKNPGWVIQWSFQLLDQFDPITWLFSREY